MAKRVADGDEASFRAIVEHTQARLYRLAARYVRDFGVTEDLVQDAYVKAYRAMRAGNYDGRSQVTTWLYRILTNTCIDYKRRRREHPTDKPIGPHFDGAVTAEARVALRELEGLLGQLADDQHAAIVLRYVEGKSNQEIASILECSEGAVEQKLFRGRKALRLLKAKSDKSRS